VTILGAGLLIGTALIVIIPEGVHMWFDSIADHAGEAGHTRQTTGPHAAPLIDGGSVHPPGQHEGHGHAGHTHNHWQMGAALALGFCFMLLIDRVSSGYGHPHGGGGAPTLPTTDHTGGQHA